MDLVQASDLARELMRLHGLSGWTFRFDRARTRFGMCSDRQKLISLSKHLTQLNAEEHVRDTILHEIAHAKVGAKAGHGPLWKAAASQVGCRAQRCYDHRQVVTPSAPWHGICPQCGQTTFRHRRPVYTYRRYRGAIRRIACGRCCREFSKGRFDERFVLVWKNN